MTQNEVDNIDDNPSERLNACAKKRKQPQDESHGSVRNSSRPYGSNDDYDHDATRTRTRRWGGRRTLYAAH